jgi:hypothetical protein
MADSESILQLGIEAARAGDKAEARELFRLVTREDSSNAQGWLWLAGVAEDREEKRTALEHVLGIDPSNDLARKGLAALGGVRESKGPPVPPAPAPVDTGVAVAPPAPSDVPAAPPGGDSGSVTSPAARMYDSPEPQQAAPAPADNTPRLTPAFIPDDYDLADYQQAPQPVAAASDAGSTVVVEDEEPRRRGGFGWLPVALTLAALALVAAFAFQRLNSPATLASGNQVATAGATAAAGSSDPDSTPVVVLGGATTAVTPTTDTTLGAATIPLTSTQVAANTGEAPPAPPQATDVGASQASAPAAETTAAANPPAAEQAAAPPPAAQTAPTGADQTVVIVPPNATVAAPATDQPQVAQANNAPPAGQPAAPAGDQTVVIVPPNATVVPPAATAPRPEAPAAVTNAPAPPAPAPAPVDPATANPAIVPNGTVVQSGPWRYTYVGQKNIATGAYGGARATRGQYQIVIVQVANNGDQSAPIPDGFFVLKDARGQVYDFNRAASVDYLNRFGRGIAADISADAPLPSSNQLTSMALLFDIPADATGLVLFSRDNPSQGFSIR